MDEALRRVQGIENQTHYEVLGLSRSASDDEIRKAFRSFARDFHMDRFSRFALTEEELGAVQKVFIAVNRANEVLSDATERNEYDISLEMSAKGSGVHNAPAGQQAESQLRDALRAEQLVRNGVQLLRNGQPAPAAEKFREAVALTPEDPVAIAGNTYADFLVAQANGGSKQMLSRACERLAEITAELENREEPFFYLGHVLTIAGEVDKAVSAFNRALKINPHYAEAKSGLRHAQRLAEKGQSSGGLFGRWKKK